MQEIHHARHGPCRSAGSASRRFNLLGRPCLLAVGLKLLMAAKALAAPGESPALLLYDDSLQNGWENWSWAATDLDFPAPARGARSIRVDAQPFQALYFNHAPLDLAPYSSLGFWLHFGPATFEADRLVVQVVLEGGAEGPAVALTAQDLPADTATWKQAVVPLASLGIPPGTNVTGFYIRNYSNEALPAFFIDDVALLVPSTPTGALTVEATTSDHGLPSRLVRWMDAGGLPRSAVMVDQRTQGAGYLRQLTYQINGADRLCRGTGIDGHQGDGYLVNHLATGGGASSHGTAGTTAVLLAGSHHAILSYDLPSYRIGGRTVPTRVQWFFANGRSHPVFALSQDARALAGNLGADARSPYGDIDYTGGSGAPVGGASFGDTYKFVTVASNPEQVTRASGWRYDEPNTIPYAMQWADSAQVDAEMGHVGTLPIGVRDQGSDVRTWPTVDPRATQDLDGPMIADDNWAYQILNYVMPAAGPTWSRRLTWGTNWGLPGGFDNYGAQGLNIREYSQHATSQNGAFNGLRADGMLLAYSVFVALGPHAGGYLQGTVGQAVQQMENAAAATFSASVGTVATSGPAGVGNAASVTIPFIPAGYNPTYATWDLAAAGNAVEATLTPAPQAPLDHPIVVVTNYTLDRLPDRVSVGDGLDTPEVDYLATLDPANQRLWITVNRVASSPVQLSVTPDVVPPDGEPDDFAAGEVEVVTAIRTALDRRPISPLIYGLNVIRPAPLPADLMRSVTMVRRGGDRANAYNWETNVSNSGIQHGMVSDHFLTMHLADPDAPAAVDLALIAENRAGNRATMVPFVLNDYVAGPPAADPPWDDPAGWDRDAFFHRVELVKPAPFAATPDLNDGVVYTDEHLDYLQSRFDGDIYAPGPARVLVGTDNEPDLWAFNFPMLQAGGGAPLLAPNGVPVGTLVTGAEFTERFLRFAQRVREIAPGAALVGPGHYHFDGWTTWHGTIPGYGGLGRWYMDDFLDAVRDASALAGQRLLDTWDFHWYPQRVFDGVPVWNLDHAARPMTPDEIEAVLQAPRSFWDPTYDEQSWITVDHLNGPANILNRLSDRLAAGYPGTGLGLTEFFPGGRHHVSSGLATADSLGIFARLGLQLAALWPAEDGNEFAFGALKLLRDADGNGLRFADTAVRVEHPEAALSSVHAGSDTLQRVTVLVINKSSAPRRFGIRLFHDAPLARVDVYRLDAAHPDPFFAGSTPLSRANAHAYSAPPLSASLLIFSAGGPCPEFMAWRLARFGNVTSPEGEPGADGDGDGLDVLTEFAFNLDPLVADARTLVPGAGTSGLPALLESTPLGPQVLGLELVRRTACGTYALEASNDLVDWETLNAPPFSVVALPDGFERIRLADLPLPDGPAPTRRFLRIKVTYGP